MAKTFKNGISLHRLLEAAPLAALATFLEMADKGEYAAIFAGLPWQGVGGDSGDAALREQLVDLGNELQPDAAVPLDRHAQRILTLAEGRGVEPVQRVAAKLFEQTHIDAFDAQLDDLGRSLWLYHHEPAMFDEAESLFYADHYRNFGGMYEAFELDADTEVAFVWDDSVKQALEAQIQERLELTGRCTVTHLQVTGKDQAGKEQQQHLVIVRHGGPLSSVAEFREADGRRAERYYRPLNEATLLFSPDEGVLEVFSASPSVRQQVATCFAEVGLKIDLSDRPLTLKQYNFKRFLTSLNLSIPKIAGFDIERVAVVDVEVRPDNPKHRAGLKVSIRDDIEEVAEELFGKDHLFKRATSMARIVIAVRYTQYGTKEAKTLNITLSEPNRCNLRSNRDPVQRDLGYALLTAWDVLHQVKPLTPLQEDALLPALLQLFDQTKKEVPGQFFLTRGLDPEALLEGGFIEPRGRYVSLLLDEDGTSHEVTVRSAGKPGVIAYAHPKDGSTVELPASAADKYAIRRDWLDEIVLKRLKAPMVSAGLTKLDENLTYLGAIQLGADVVPCYLARDLRSPATLQRLDILMRARSDKGVGLVLSAGRDHPLCLGPNVIAAVADHLSGSDDASSLDIVRLASVFTQGKQLARGGMVVALVKKDNYSASLYIPGKPSLALAGVKAIGFFQALVEAYQKGSPAVPTKQLMAAAGSSAATPRQLLGNDLWNSVEGVYVCFPPGVKRGSYQLLV